jgi:pilus assembly protein CpaE
MNKGDDNMSRVKILIADDVKETRDVIKRILTLDSEKFEVVGEAKDGEEVLKIIPKCKPDVILMDINMPIMNGLEATEKITEDFPNVIVIIMSVQADSEYLKRAMFSGAKEYIIKPFDYDNLVNTILPTYNKYKGRGIKLVKNEEEKDAKVVTYYSSKGGVGKSILSLNNAIMLSKTYKKKTLLIDLDLQFGDISIMINRHANRTLLDIVDENQYDTYEHIKPYLSKYNDNLDVLLAPKTPEGGEYISKESIESIIKNSKKHYDVIIVDTGINFDDVTLSILDISELILIVTTMEITSVKNTKLSLGVMKSLNYDNNKVKIIINFSTKKNGVNIKDLEEVFKDNIFGKIPEEKNVATSVNKGKPICDDYKHESSKFFKGIKDISKSLITL